jgi:hypothetical protein
MAYFSQSQRKENIKILLGDGINTYTPDGLIKRSECISNLNMSSRKYPSLCTRAGRTHAADSITNTNGIGSYRDSYYYKNLDIYLHAVDGTVWKRWNANAWANVQTGLTNGTANFVNFNTSTKNYIIMVNGYQKFAWDGSSVTTLTDAPATNLYTVDDRRLYALKGDVLYISAGGSITDWTTVNDAMQLVINGSRGLATCICTYKDTVICFFENSMHILYGNDPFDFDLSDPISIGCVGSKAVIEHNGILYFVYNDGLYRFAGGQPEKLSQKVDGYFSDIPFLYWTLVCLGKYDRWIYMSITYGAAATDNNITLVYDTHYGVWNVHNVGYADFTQIAGDLIGIDTDGQTWVLNSGNDDNSVAIASQWISGWIDMSVISKKKRLTKQYYLLYLPTGSTLTLYYSNDGSSWTSLKAFSTSSSEQIVAVPVSLSVLSSVSRYKFKFVGTGQWRINQVDEYFNIKKRL